MTSALHLQSSYLETEVIELKMTEPSIPPFILNHPARVLLWTCKLLLTKYNFIQPLAFP